MGSTNTGQQSIVRQKRKRTRDMCADFGVSPVTIWRWERDGILPPSKKINGQKTWEADVQPKFDEEAA
jgi:predicted site-specific integrase-resolvase